MFPATWQRTNPTNWGNERGGTDAPFGSALVEMPDTRCARLYTKTADDFNTEDVPGDMAEDESCESGE